MKEGNMTDQKPALDLTAIRERRETAFEWVFAMRKGKTRFKMSIPYEKTDTDAILCAALKDSETLAAEVETLRAALDAARDAMVSALVYHHHSLSNPVKEELNAAVNRAGRALAGGENEK